MSKKKDGNWFRRHKILTGVLAFVVLMIIIVNATTDPETKTENNNSNVNNSQQSQADPAQKAIADKLVVTNSINKKVDGKYRYFFDIKNDNATPVSATVIVTVVSKDDSFKMSTDFGLIDLQPGLHKNGFRELNTGNTAGFGASAIGKFRYTVKIGNNSYDYPDQPLTDKFEDLSGL